jgi:uncharacterized protein YeaC (DUF1315 family)
LILFIYLCVCHFIDIYWLICFIKGISPEIFARTTCADLGLPPDMEPAISHKIRENILRSVVSWMDEGAIDCSQATVETNSELKVSLVQPNQAVDMIANLCKRAKPNSIDDQAAIPQPMLPTDKDSNSSFWNVPS